MNQGNQFESHVAVDLALNNKFCLNAKEDRKLIASERNGIIHVKVLDADTDTLVADYAFMKEEITEELYKFVYENFSSCGGDSKIDVTVVHKNSHRSSYQVKLRAGTIINAGMRVSYSMDFRTLAQAENKRRLITEAVSAKNDNFVNRVIWQMGGFAPYNDGSISYDEMRNRAYYYAYTNKILSIKDLPQEHIDFFTTEILDFIQKKYPRNVDAKYRDRPSHMISNNIDTPFELEESNVREYLIPYIKFEQPSSTTADKLITEIIQNDNNEFTLVASLPYQVRGSGPTSNFYKCLTLNNFFEKP